MYVERSYRSQAGNPDLAFFKVVVKETDLYIGVDRDSYHPELPEQVEQLVWRLRREMDDYIGRDPVFRTTLEPHLLLPGAPPLAQEMGRAAWKADVGPMAAVAGAFAEAVGRWLLTRAKEVLVENGGDIFLKIEKTRKIGIFAGQSPFSGRLALEIEPGQTPLGICTSSGTVGPSYSAGKADAALVMAASAALADAAASAVGNAVQGMEDVEKAVQVGQEIEGVVGVLVIKDNRLGAWGQVKLRPLNSLK
ncbi:MAG: UPF0280 family protein [Firmicutes bacterium]|nr:UPF0280 family protein [Bacillota bacterium]